MIKRHGPGGCCCDWYYCWYMDEDDTEDTDNFVRVPSVWLASMDSPAGVLVGDSSIDVWTIDALADKTIGLSSCPGFQTTQDGEAVTELVWTTEYRDDGLASHLTLYTCIGSPPDGQVVIDSYRFTSQYESWAFVPPSVLPTANDGYINIAEYIHGWAIAYGAQAEGDTYRMYRGFIDFDVGNFVEWSCLGEVDPEHGIEEDSQSFGLVELAQWEDDGHIEIHGPIPQAFAPRYWPYAAAVEHLYYNEPPTGNTIYPQCSIMVGKVSVEDGSFQFNQTQLISILGGGPISGEPWLLLGRFRGAWRTDIMAYDQSPGGPIILAYVYERYPIDGDITQSGYRYWVHLYINDVLVDSHECRDENGDWDDRYSSPYFEMVHAVHRNPKKDRGWLYVLPYNSGVPLSDSEWKVRCYEASGTMLWSTPVSQYGTIPVVLWSSDRWIYVEQLTLSAEDVEEKTDGKWTEEHDQWLISHDGQLYVPMGVRESNGTLTTKQVSNQLNFDTIKNSRNLPYSPPAGVF